MGFRRHFPEIAELGTMDSGRRPEQPPVISFSRSGLGPELWRLRPWKIMGVFKGHFGTLRRRRRRSVLQQARIAGSVAQLPAGFPLTRTTPPLHLRRLSLACGPPELGVKNGAGEEGHFQMARIRAARRL